MFGLWFLFSQDPTEPTSYHEYSIVTWITICAVLMYFVYGIVVEGSVLLVRKYWPQPKADDFEIVAATAKLNHDTFEYDVDLPSKVVTLVYRDGRPTCDQIFEVPRQSVEPGIFMCGPASLTSMVKKEASKENSYFGLTRFCLYDEPYEM